MKVLVKKTLHYYMDKYPIAEKQLHIWHNEFSEMTFKNFNELKKVYGNASIVNNNRVVFNIRGNDFRLVVSINFHQQTCYLYGLERIKNTIKSTLKRLLLILIY